MADDAVVGFHIEITTEEPGSGMVPQVEVIATEITIEGDRVSGSAGTISDDVVPGFASAGGLLFNTDGEIAGWFSSYLISDVEPGATGRFSRTSVYGEITDSWMIAGTGPARQLQVDSLCSSFHE